MRTNLQHKEELILTINKLPMLRVNLLRLLEEDIPLLQKEVYRLRSEAYTHPRIIIECIEGQKYDELKSLAEYNNLFHQISNLLNLYLGNSIN